MRPSFALLALGALVVALLKGALPTVPAEAAERHSGTVVKVDLQAGTLVVEELTALGKKQELRVWVPSMARVVLSERLPDSEVSDPQHPFKETAIGLSDIRPGDLVVVEVTTRGGKTASRVTVTSRGGSK